MNFLEKNGPPLIDNGYSIIPIKEGTKYPAGVKDWQNIKSAEEYLDTWVKNSSLKGVGVLSADTPGVDIDVLESEIVKKMVVFCEKNVGPAPRRIGNPPKTILVYRTENPFKKIKSSKYKCLQGLTHQVEILGDGQQFVAFAVHPDTKKDYIWPDKSILEIPHGQLTLITESQAVEIVEYFESIVPDDWKLVASRKEQSQTPQKTGDAFANYKPPLDISIKEIKNALSKLDSDDYDHWIKVGMALHHQYDGKAGGFELWNEWSLKSGKYEPGETEEKWRTFKADLKSTNPVSFATVLKWSKEKDLEKKTETRALSLVHASEIENKLGPVDWLVKNYIESNTIGLFYGESKSFKSFINLDIALHIVTGKPWNGNPVKQGPVIYVAGEGHGGYARRLKAWTQTHKVDISNYPFYFTTQAVNLSDENSVQKLGVLIDGIAEAEGVVVEIVIDTLARNFGHGDENSTTDMGRFIENVDRFLRVPYECVVSIVHHTGHSNKERARGSSALRSGVDFEYQIKTHKKFPFKVELTCTKMKDAKEPYDIWFQGEKVCLGFFGDEELDSLIFRKTESPDKEAPSLKGKQKNLNELWEEIKQVDMKEFQKMAIERGIVLDSKDFSTTIFHLKKKGYEYMP